MYNYFLNKVIKKVSIFLLAFVLVSNSLVVSSSHYTYYHEYFEVLHDEVNDYVEYGGISFYTNYIHRVDHDILEVLRELLGEDFHDLFYLHLILEDTDDELMYSIEMHGVPQDRVGVSGVVALTRTADGRLRYVIINVSGQSKSVQGNIRIASATGLIMANAQVSEPNMLDGTVSPARFITPVLAVGVPTTVLFSLRSTLANGNTHVTNNPPVLLWSSIPVV